MLSDLQNECKGILSVKDRNSWNGADDGSWCLMVGKIKIMSRETAGSAVGTEKGMFEFGGSTVILMTEPGKVQPDEDLIRNTEAGMRRW